jgi:hypothetical protein
VDLTVFPARSRWASWPGGRGAVMTATLDDVTTRKKKREPTAEQRAAEEPVRRATEQGMSLTGPDGCSGN